MLYLFEHKKEADSLTVMIFRFASNIVRKTPILALGVSKDTSELLVIRTTCAGSPL